MLSSTEIVTTGELTEIGESRSCPVMRPIRIASFCPNSRAVEVALVGERSTDVSHRDIPKPTDNGEPGSWIGSDDEDGVLGDIQGYDGVDRVPVKVFVGHWKRYGLVVI